MISHNEYINVKYIFFFFSDIVTVIFCEILAIDCEKSTKICMSTFISNTIVCSIIDTA